MSQPPMNQVNRSLERAHALAINLGLAFVAMAFFATAMLNRFVFHVPFLSLVPDLLGVVCLVAYWIRMRRLFAADGQGKR